MSARTARQLSGPEQKARPPRSSSCIYQFYTAQTSSRSTLIQASRRRSRPHTIKNGGYVRTDHAALDGAVAEGSSTFFVRRRRLEIECTNPAARPCDGPWSSPFPALNVREAALTQYLLVRARWEEKRKNEMERSGYKYSSKVVLRTKPLQMTMTTCTAVQRSKQNHMNTSTTLVLSNWVTLGSEGLY